MSPSSEKYGATRNIQIGQGHVMFDNEQSPYKVHLGSYTNSF